MEVLLVVTTIAWCFAMHYYIFYEQIEREKKEKKRIRRTNQEKTKQRRGIVKKHLTR